MQTVSLISNRQNVRLLETKTPLRLRALRFVSDRYTHRERPGVAAEFILFAVIVLTATWPIVNLVQAMTLIR